jgi:hypothetical protein
MTILNDQCSMINSQLSMMQDQWSKGECPMIKHLNIEH